MDQEVRNAINDIRPNLQADGGDIQLVNVNEAGVVTVKLTGACHGCPMAQQTLKQGVEQYLRQKVSGVTSVVSA
jgi:Fe-S cluster biogenesis protein NfuA